MTVAQRDRDWPGYTQWFVCPACHALWTPCDAGVAAIKRSQLITTPSVSSTTPPQSCPVCTGTLKDCTHEL